MGDSGGRKGNKSEKCCNYIIAKNKVKEEISPRETRYIN